MAVVSSLSCNLQLTPRINWTTGQEKSIVKDYPFTDLTQETPDQYVVRTYLQFLWLPESIMPLKMLIESLKRVNVASGSSQPEEPRPHPLHDLLDPLLHTPRSAAQKYHMELPKILRNGEGAGEIEETMMWYVLSYEKGNQEDDVVGGTSNVIEVWEDDKWRSDWLQRMERREVQIQILLHFLLLSLPGPTPLPPPPPPELSSVKRRKQTRKKAIPIPSIEDRLEVFMDKLSTWQLMVDLNSSPVKDKIDDGLDWMQAFSRDVVDPQFRSLLPEQCDLLRSKVFPQSPFTDDEDLETQTLRSSSPDSRPIKRLRTTSNTAAPQSGAPNSRYLSPALSSTSSRIDREYSSKKSGSRKLERSRSLSLSLAEEAEERRRAASTGPSRRLLTREVSMNRSFKNVTKASQENADSSQSQSTAVKSTVKPIKSENKDQGLTLVEATPVKPREKRVRALSRAPSQSQSQILVPESPTKPVGGLMGSLSFHASTIEEEEEWQLLGNTSPSVLYLHREHDSDDELTLGK
ncbi:hypothetical protein E1B28_004729 [Marasmius oreades]|uniref:DNA replication regulator Sld3 C-terminal domain-containing protein n=1 Tax=Marasmius oreades TaxID=181124 RepID=A0A9P8ADA0_9AGAR|nr:uncharacterized protein E1B28_004729 [Marasmius oreades]KAG7097379.1 hypothetical protein E1B28_004729 [Marasmius oreades]